MALSVLYTFKIRLLISQSVGTYRIFAGIRAFPNGQFRGVSTPLSELFVPSGRSKRGLGSLSVAESRVDSLWNQFDKAGDVFYAVAGLM